MTCLLYSSNGLKEVALGLQVISNTFQRMATKSRVGGVAPRVQKISWSDLKVSKVVIGEPYSSLGSNVMGHGKEAGKGG